MVSLRSRRFHGDHATSGTLVCVVDPDRSAPRVLVVDDEENITYLVSAALALDGYQVQTAASGTEAVRAAAAFAPDAIVLDVMLGDLDGFEVLSRLRSSGCDVPVLFLTARHDTADRVRGLNEGGDDYIVKPFALEELRARVQVALRRSRRGQRSSNRLEVGPLVLDDDSHRVWRDGDEVLLTGTEYKLLRWLMMNAGRVVTRASILDHVWEYDFAGDSEIIDSFMSTLRKKVDHTAPRLITTVRGVGYRIAAPTT